MRHSEFHQSAKGKPDSNQLKTINYSPDLSSFMAEDDFVELLWENGQVVMQGQSIRNKKSAVVDRVPREQRVDGVNEKDARDLSSPKTGRLDAMNSLMHNFSLPGPSNHGQLHAQDDDMIPWMNYPMEDTLPNNYCSEFLSDEIPGDNLNTLSVHNSSASIPRSSLCQTFRGPFSVENGNTFKIIADTSDPSRTRTTQFYELLHQSQTSDPSTRSRDEDFCTGGGNDSQQGPSGNLDFTRLQKQDIATSKPFNQNSIGVLNFSHFSRPVALAKANLHSVERLKNSENSSTVTSSKTMNSTVIQSATGIPTNSEGPLSPSPITMKLDDRSTAKTFRKIPPFEQSKVEYQKYASRMDVKMNNAGSSYMSTDHGNHRSTNLRKDLPFCCSETERGHEAMVASSSVCSGNSAEGASHEHKQRDKRKDQEGEESGNHSAGLEDESVGQKKSASTKGTSAKRSRAAEVHNLSERRRRDRINEKMHALQELIPNCNKVDKASMLDEAIEYLKTLQLQVQMMSMGSGLCMPPMMPSAGMQHMRMAPIAHFSQMGLGMGMGMRFGYGMGMFDMNGPPKCTLPLVPPMQTPQFRCTSPSVPMPQGLPLVPGSNTFPMFGMPRQGLPLPITSVPSTTGAPGLSKTVSSVLEVSPGPSDVGPLKNENVGKCRDNDSQGIRKSFKDSTFMHMSCNETHTSENQAAK